MPPYFADLIMLQEVTSTTDNRLIELYESLRPFGGCLVLPKSLESRISGISLVGASIDRQDTDYIFVRRSGSLPGTTNYMGDWEKSPDALVKAPLGVLWFGDQTSSFKRSPPTEIHQRCYDFDR